MTVSQAGPRPSVYQTLRTPMAAKLQLLRSKENNS